MDRGAAGAVPPYQRKNGTVVEFSRADEDHLMTDTPMWSRRAVWTRSRFAELVPMTPRMAMLTVGYAVLLAIGTGAS